MRSNLQSLRKLELLDFIWDPRGSNMGGRPHCPIQIADVIPDYFKYLEGPRWSGRFRQPESDLCRDLEYLTVLDCPPDQPFGVFEGLGTYTMGHVE
jgi:hypothetical protein